MAEENGRSGRNAETQRWRKQKSSMISLIQSKLFKGTVVPEDRSLMNVPFVTGDKDMDAKFVKEATRGRTCKLERTPYSRRYACKYL